MQYQDEAKALARAATVILAILSATPTHGAVFRDIQPPSILLLGLGDSLTHRTMDATNNATNTLNAYLQRVATSLSAVTEVEFSQPLYDATETRVHRFQVPTNIGVDGISLHIYSFPDPALSEACSVLLNVKSWQGRTLPY